MRSLVGYINFFKVGLPNIRGSKYRQDALSVRNALKVRKQQRRRTRMAVRSCKENLSDIVVYLNLRTKFMLIYKTY